MSGRSYIVDSGQSSQVVAMCPHRGHQPKDGIRAAMMLCVGITNGRPVEGSLVSQVRLASLQALAISHGSKTTHPKLGKYPK